MTAKIKPILMPKWGLAMKEGSITSWLKNEGEILQKGEVFVEIETEKVVNEYESPDDGILLKKVLGEGEKVPVGTLIGVLSEEKINNEEVNNFIEEFQSNFIPIEVDEEIENLEKIISIQNLSINYLNLSDNKDKTLLFIHGFGGDLNNWMFNQEELSSTYNTYSLDLPGHGKSSKNIDIYSLEYLTSIIKDFCISNKLKKVNLIGHSLGGGLCINLVKTNPDLVESLTLISPIGLGKEIDNYVEKFIFASTRKELKPELEKLYFNTDLITRDLLNEVLKFKRLDGVSKTLTKIMREVLFEKGEQKTSLRELISNLNININVIWGAEDKIIPTEHCNDLPSSIKCYILENSGHMSHIEKSKEVNDIILKTIK